MINRLKKIIEREKLQNPGQQGLVLLFKRINSVLYSRFRNLMIILRRDGTFSSEAEMFMCSLLPVKVLDIILNEIKPDSVLDVGCGTGKTLEYLKNHGVEVIGIENSKIAISQSAFKERIIKHNLNNELNLNRQFDVVWCFEVIEHIHPKYEKAFLDTLTNHSAVIILSAARPGQGGHGHFNEQEPVYWINKFIERGYSLDHLFTNKLKATMEMHSENLLCFKR